MKINSERGAALPLVLIAVVLGAIVVPAFLGHIDSSIIGSGVYADAIYSEYASDAGVEHAIWRLTDGGLTSNLTYAGSMVNYSLAEAINGLTTNITVSNAWQTIASDNFNSGTWTGGTGWTDNWTHSGESVVTTSGTPYEGTNHLRLRSSTGLVSRSVDLSHQVDIHLRFWAKFNSLETWDTAICQVSSDGVNWSTVYTWDNSYSDNIYHFYDIDLSSYEMTSRFWIRFDSNMSSTGDYFYVDKLDIVWLLANPVTFAWDDFESGNWTGGAGWTDNWTHSGYSDVIWWSSPYEGWYHLRLRSSTGDVRRSVDLTQAGIVHLRFWAKVDSFESGDNAVCQVSANGTSWTTVYTWTRSHSDNTYHNYDISLASFPMTSRFWIRFDSNTNNTNDYFYVDKIELVNLDTFGITVKAGDKVIKAKVLIDDGVVTILSWYYV